MHAAAPHAGNAIDAGRPTAGEMLWEIVDLVGGLTVMLLPLLLLPLPGIILFLVLPALLVLAVAAVPAMIAAAIIAVPYLLVRAVRAAQGPAPGHRSVRRELTEIPTC